MADKSKARQGEAMNFRERMVNLLAPGKAMDMYRRRTTPQESRQRAREMPGLLTGGRTATASQYYHHAASRTKNSMVGWMVGGGSAEEDIDSQSSTMRTRSRDLYAGGGLGRGAPATLATNVVGSGIHPSPKIDYELLGISEQEAVEWQRSTLREFNLWADSAMCDANRQNNFWALQQLAFLSMLVSGDVFVLFGTKENRRTPYQTVIRLIEADRVSTPDSNGESTVEDTQAGGRIIDGVEISADGEVVRYHIATYHPLQDDTPKENEWTHIDAYGPQTGMPLVLHLMIAERPEQHRGIPLIAGMIEAIKQLDRYTESEVMASLVGALLTVFIYSDNPEDDGPDGINDGINEDEKVTDDPMRIELGNGNVYELPPGKKVDHVGVNRTPSAFADFVNQIITMIGSGLEIPYEVMTHRYNSNYTAARAAELDFRMVVRRFRKSFTDKFCQPIYEAWLAEAVALGRVECPGFFDDPLIRAAWCGCQWIGMSKGHVQPVQEANAARIRMESHITTGAQEAMEYNGGDYMENIAQYGRETAAIKAATPKEETSNG